MQQIEIINKILTRGCTRGGLTKTIDTVKGEDLVSHSAIAILGKAPYPAAKTLKSNHFSGKIRLRCIVTRQI